MGQKVNPIGFRLGVVRGWDSNWYGGKDFSEKLVEDEKIRRYLFGRIPRGAISKVIIERTLKRITITINTARPGVVIGRGGNEVEMIRQELQQITKKEVQINIYEIKRPEIDAMLVAITVAQQLESRVSYRRATKQAISNAMRVGAQGIKVRVSGRLGGADMARSEIAMEGRVPLHTLRADIDYATAEANTVYGKIGVKVWIFKGEVYGKRDLTPMETKAKKDASTMRSDEGGGHNRGEGGNRGGEGGNRGGRGGNNRGGSGGGNDRGGNNRGGSGGSGNNNNRGGGNNNNRGGSGGGNNKKKK